MFYNLGASTSVQQVHSYVNSSSDFAVHQCEDIFVLNRFF